MIESRKGPAFVSWRQYAAEDQRDEAWQWFRAALADAMRYKEALLNILDHAEGHSGDIYALDGVADGAILGMPDDKWGEIGVAVVVRQPGASLTEDDVIAHFQGKVARFKIPARVAFMGELPRNATGKVLKRALRQMLAD